MKVRFKKGDPRAGMVAEFDTGRGRELVESGAATEVKANAREDADDADPAPAKKATKKKAD